MMVMTGSQCSPADNLIIIISSISSRLLKGGTFPFPPTFFSSFALFLH